MGQHKFIFKSLIILVVLVAAFFAYRFFFLAPKIAPPEGLNSSLDPELGAPDQTTDEFIALINELQGVNLRTDLFAHPAYQALKNFSRPLIEEPKGRPNPFLPIPMVIGAVTATTTATTTPRR